MSKEYLVKKLCVLLGVETLDGLTLGEYVRICDSLTFKQQTEVNNILAKIRAYNKGV